MNNSGLSKLPTYLTPSVVRNTYFRLHIFAYEILSGYFVHTLYHNIYLSIMQLHPQENGWPCSSRTSVFIYH